MEELNGHISSTIKVVGFWRRVRMTLLDWVIAVIPITILYIFSLKFSIRTESVLPFVIYWLFFSVTMIFFTVKYGGTLGKLIMKAKIVDNHGRNLTIVRSIYRIIFYIIYAISMIILLNEAIYMKVDEKNIGNYMANSNGVIGQIILIISFVSIISALFVAFNRNRRAIHDFLAGSYVIDTRTTNNNINNTVES